MPYTKTSWVANVTPVTAVSMNNIEAGIASLSAPAPSATPPASPADGDLWYLPASASGGMTWQMRYNAGSASAYKWEFVGGSGVVTAALGDITTSSTSPVAMTTGPTITVPRAGEYTVDLCLNVISNGANTGYASTAVFEDATDTGVGVTFVFAYGGAGSRVDLATFGIIPAAAGQVLALRVSCANGLSNRFLNARLRLCPIRVS